MTDHDFVKVELHEGDRVETPWAELLSENEYRLENSPFWAYGVSYNDVIAAHPREDGSLPVFTSVVRKGGHRTVRVVLDPPADEAPESQAVLDGLVEIGCTYEGMTPGYLAIDIPPGVSLDRVREYLISKDVQWEHVDPTYEELFSNESEA